MFCRFPFPSETLPARAAVLASAVALCAPLSARAESVFFEIGDPKVVTRAPVSREPLIGTKKEFRPYLEVEVRARAPIPTPGCFVRAYFYNDAKRLIATAYAPESRDFDGVKASLPAFFPTENRPLPCGFFLPEAVRKERDWRCVIVAGDAQETTARAYPGGLVSDYDFPEKASATNPDRAPKEHALKAIRLAQKEIFTGVPEYPKITVFLKTPASVTAPREARGVLAMCITAGSVDGIKRRLLLDEEHDDVYHLLRYAERRQLLVLCWGSHKIWDGSRDWDQLSPEVSSAQKRMFDKVASAWARGVKDFAAAQGFEAKDMLLWGYCASAQYAKRLALRQPGLFRAVYLHIPSSFDEPTREAKGPLWCLSAGERDFGYEGSYKFFLRCRELDYPMFYKVIPNLGHSDAAGCHRLARQFFDYALSRKPGEGIGEPEYYGDWLNQTVVTKARAELIPANQRVPLPDAQWAAVWELREADAFEAEEKALLAQEESRRATEAAKLAGLQREIEEGDRLIERMRALRKELLTPKAKIPKFEFRPETLRAAEESLGRLFREHAIATTYGKTSRPDAPAPESAAMKQAGERLREIMKESVPDKAPDGENTLFGRRMPKTETTR